MKESFVCYPYQTISLRGEPLNITLSLCSIRCLVLWFDYEKEANPAQAVADNLIVGNLADVKPIDVSLAT